MTQRRYGHLSGQRRKEVLLESSISLGGPIRRGYHGLVGFAVSKDAEWNAGAAEAQLHVHPATGDVREINE
jgi:hypothetical protein